MADACLEGVESRETALRTESEGGEAAPAEEAAAAPAEAPVEAAAEKPVAEA